MQTTSRRHHRLLTALPFDRARRVLAALVVASVAVVAMPVLASAAPGDVRVVDRALLIEAMGDAGDADTFIETIGLRQPTESRLATVVGAVPPIGGNRLVADTSSGSVVIDVVSDEGRIRLTEVQPGPDPATSVIVDGLVVPQADGTFVAAHVHADGTQQFSSSGSTELAAAPLCDVCSAFFTGAGLVLSVGCGVYAATAGAATQGLAYLILCGGGVGVAAVAALVGLLYCPTVNCPRPSTTPSFAYFAHTSTECEFSSCTSKIKMQRNGYALTSLGSSISWVYPAGSAIHCTGGAQTQATESFTWSTAPYLPGSVEVYQKQQNSSCPHWTKCTTRARISITATFSGGGNRLQTTGWFDRVKPGLPTGCPGYIVG